MVKRQVRCFFKEATKAYVELPLCNHGNFGKWLDEGRQEHDVTASLHQVTSPINFTRRKGWLGSFLRCW